MIAEAIERYRDRVHGLVPSLGDGVHEDLVAAIIEAERSLLVAGRAIRRAERTAS